MPLIDIKAIQSEAQKQINEEKHKEAVFRLKDLYLRKAKAELVIKNIDRDIENYLKSVQELVVYASAGCE